MLYVLILEVSLEDKGGKVQGQICEERSVTTCVYQIGVLRGLTILDKMVFGQLL